MAFTDTVKEMFTSSSLRTLHDLFVDMLQDVYDAEQQIYAALPKMQEQATSTALQHAFKAHHQETAAHITRLEQIFDLLDLPATRKTCEATEGLIAEADEVMDDAETGVMDAALVAASQGIEHYEIARYGTLKAWAEELNLPQAAALLDKTLTEETATNQKLTQLALGGINQTALGTTAATNRSTFSRPTR